MARLTVGLVFGFVVGVVAGAAAGLHAEGDEATALAAEVGVDEQDLRAAADTVGVSPRTYLEGEGVLSPQHAGQAPVPTAGQGGAAVQPPVASASPFSNRIECLIRYESGGNPNAYNRSSGAAGLAQFLLSTWMSTPQGKAGLSRFDPVAARAATAWMLSQGRAREWVPVRLGLC